MMTDEQKIKILWSALATIHQAVSDIADMDALRAFVLRKAEAALNQVPEPGEPDEGKPL